jgi:Ala-tRNA(Pro) deacylase
MQCRERLEAWFREQRVSFDRQQHSEAFTAQQVAAAEHISGYWVAKVVMAVADGMLAMLVLPAPHRVDLVRLKGVLRAGSVRLAREEEFANLFPDCETGAMPPFGNLYGVPVYVDVRLAQDPHIVFNAGTHRETMRIAYADYERLARPDVADFAVSPQAA